LIWLCVVLLLSLSIHERRSAKPLRREADTRRACLPPPFRAFGRRLCLHVLSSFQRTGPPSLLSERRRGIQATAHPAWLGVLNRYFNRVQGNLPTLLQPVQAVNIFHTVTCFSALAQSRRQGRCCEDLPSWCPTWEPGKPGTWGHPQFPNRNRVLTNAESES